MKRNLYRIAVFAVSLFMMFAVLAACGRGTEDDDEPAPTPTPAPVATPTPEPAPVGGQEEEEVDELLAYFLRDWGPEPDFVWYRPDRQPQQAPDTTPLVVRGGGWTGLFTPFWGRTASDNGVWSFGSDFLLTTTRTAAIVMNAIQGEYHYWQGERFFYQGTTNWQFVPNYPEPGLYTYRMRIRSDMRFHDGVPVTIDDVIFAFYTYWDPDFVARGGNAPIAPILGLQEWRSQLPADAFPLIAELRSSDAGNPASAPNIPEDIFNMFWEAVFDTWTTEAPKVVADTLQWFPWISANFPVSPDEALEDEQWHVAGTMLLWNGSRSNMLVITEDGGFYSPATGQSWTAIDGDVPTMEDFINAAWNCEIIGVNKESIGNLFGGTDNEALFGVATELTVAALAEAGIGGEVPTRVEGLRRLSDHALEIVITEFQAGFIWNLSMAIIPMHHYGDPALFDYENDMFGFPFGDVSMAYAQNSNPLGSGLFRWDRWEHNRMFWEASQYNWRGVPHIRHIQMVDSDTEGDQLIGIETGEHDIAGLMGNPLNLQSVRDANANGELSGDVVHAVLNPARIQTFMIMYGATMNVDGQPFSQESIYFRKGFATVLAALREFHIQSWFGETGVMINYPISIASWAAPQPQDDGYRIAFNWDRYGNVVHTPGMSHDERVQSAIQASLGFFERAGYTVDWETGRLTDPPPGTRRNTIWGNELCYWNFEMKTSAANETAMGRIFAEAEAIFGAMGLNAIHTQIEFSTLWNIHAGGNSEITNFAWAEGQNPDLRFFWHTDNLMAAENVAGSNLAYFSNARVDYLSALERTDEDIAFRRAIFLEAFNIIMDYGVILPVFNRADIQMFSAERINIDTLPPGMSTDFGWGGGLLYMQLR